MNRGVIKFVDPSGLTRRVLVRKKSEGPPAISFPDFTKYICGVFGLTEGTIVRIKYIRDRDDVVVEDEMGWEEACLSLLDNEALDVDIQVKQRGGSDTRGVLWQQITKEKNHSPPSLSMMSDLSAFNITMAPHLLEDRKRKRRSSSLATINPDIACEYLATITPDIVSEYQENRNIQDEPNPESYVAHEEISAEEEERLTEGDDNQSKVDECLSNEESEVEDEAAESEDEEDSDSESISNLECEEDEESKSKWENDEEEDEESKSKWVHEEEDEESKSKWEHEEEDDEEDSDSDEKTDVNVEDNDKGRLLNMFSKLSVSAPTNNTNGSIVSLRVKFARDCLWKRHLISRSEMENFEDEDVKFCVWRMESRLGRAVVEAHRKWANILTHDIPLTCPPMALTLAEKLYTKEIQWSDKVVEIFLTWLYCGDGYCFIQTEEELLETRVTLERLLRKRFNRELLGYGEDEQQRMSLMKLRDRLGNLKKYILELFDDGEDHLPLDRRFRVNQICSHTLDNFDAGKYGYAFFGTSTVAYRHGVLWEGFHVFNQHHVFAQDITVTFTMGPQHEYARYFEYQEMPEGPYNFRRRNQSFFRLVFVCDPEAEIRSAYEFLQHARRVTDNAAKDNCIFDSADTEIEEFQVGIFHSTSDAIGEAAINLNLQETTHTYPHSANQLYSIYKGDLRDLLALVATGAHISEKQSLQASLIVRNPAEETFFTIYSSSEVIGYCFEGNFLVVSSSVSVIESLIQAIQGKVTSFNWRQSHSPRNILELRPQQISPKNKE